MCIGYGVFVAGTVGPDPAAAPIFIMASIILLFCARMSTFFSSVPRFMPLNLPDVAYRGGSVYVDVLLLHISQRLLQMCSRPRRAVRYHSLVCSKNSLLIIGIGPILDKEL